MGTYIHGLFVSDEFRNKLVTKLSSEEREENVSYHQNLNFILEEFVSVLEDNLDIDLMLSAARKV
jgi:cobyric acid synthase